MSLSDSMTQTAPPAARPLLSVENVRRTFVRARAFWSSPILTRALDGVSFDLLDGEILGVVGESGCGKSTLARIIVGLESADEGCIVLDGRTLVGPELKHGVPPSRRGIQMVFQDPYASLNPRMRMWELVAEGLAIAGVAKNEQRERAAEALALVGLRPGDGDRYAYQFSGGQRQRVGIARALLMKPKVLIADEAVSALDVSVQMQILNLLLDIRERQGISLLFITHNISVVEYLCDRVIVLSAGRIVERGEALAVVEHPQHAYTKRLISAVPRL